MVSASIVATGLQGTYLHARGIGQEPGGWKNFTYNIGLVAGTAGAVSRHGQDHPARG